MGHQKSTSYRSHTFSGELARNKDEKIVKISQNWKFLQNKGKKNRYFATCIHVAFTLSICWPAFKRYSMGQNVRQGTFRDTRPNERVVGWAGLLFYTKGMPCMLLTSTKIALHRLNGARGFLTDIYWIQKVSASFRR